MCLRRLTFHELMSYKTACFTLEKPWSQAKYYQLSEQKTEELGLEREPAPVHVHGGSPLWTVEPYFAPRKPCEKPIMVARSLGEDRVIARVLWQDNLTYLGTACPVRETLSQNKMWGGLEVGRLSQSCICHMTWCFSKISTTQLQTFVTWMCARGVITVLNSSLYM